MIMANFAYDLRQTLQTIGSRFQERYIRMFDVISELRCVLPRRKIRFKNFALYSTFAVKSELNCVSPSRRRRFKKGLLIWTSTLYPNLAIISEVNFFWCRVFFELRIYSKANPIHFEVLLPFLSLKLGAELRRSRLVVTSF